MKKKFSVKLYTKKIVVFSSLLVFLLVGMWCDYNTALAVTGGISWVQSLPYFFEQMVFNIGSMNGLSANVDEDAMHEALDSLWKSKSTEEIYQEILPKVKERYPYDKFFKTAGWTQEEWEIFCEADAEYHASSYSVFGYKSPTTYGNNFFIIDEFYDNVMGTIDQALKDDTIKDLCASSGNNIDTLSMINFCYQSKQAVKSETVSKFGTITTPMGMAVNMVIGVASQCMADIFDNPLFKHMNLLYRAGVYEKYNDALMHPSASSGVGCDYSASWWIDNPVFINAKYQNILYEFRFKNFEETSDLDKTYVYPLVFKDPKYARPYYYGFASSDYFKLTVSASFSDGKWRGINLGDSLTYSPYTIEANGKWQIQDIWGSRAILDGTTAYINAPNVIDVGTRENYEKFCEKVRSGEYTLAELLNLIEKGWVANPEYEKAVAKDGTVAKDVIDKSKDKYKEKDEDYVTAGSIATGVSGAAEAGESDLYGDNVLTPERTWEDLLGGSSEAMERETEKAWTATQEGVLEGVNVVDRVIDRETYKDAVLEGTKPGTGGNDGNLPFIPGTNIPNGDDIVNWYERFPFCIPWDIYRFISVFSDEPIKPKWSIPFKITRLKIDEEIKIDFSSGDYDHIVKVIRIFLLFSYSFCLVMISRNVIKG